MTRRYYPKLIPSSKLLMGKCSSYLCNNSSSFFIKIKTTNSIHSNVISFCKYHMGKGEWYIRNDMGKRTCKNHILRKLNNLNSL